LAMTSFADSDDSLRRSMFLVAAGFILDAVSECCLARMMSMKREGCDLKLVYRVK
jgi:hypothetical protein